MSKEITVSFASDNPDDIAYVLAFWDLIIHRSDSSESLSMVTTDHYGALFDVWKTHLNYEIKEREAMGLSTGVIASVAEWLKKYD